MLQSSIIFQDPFSFTMSRARWVLPLSRFQILLPIKPWHFTHNMTCTTCIGDCWMSKSWAHSFIFSISMPNLIDFWEWCLFANITCKLLEVHFDIWILYMSTWIICNHMHTFWLLPGLFNLHCVKIGFYFFGLAYLGYSFSFFTNKLVQTVTIFLFVLDYQYKHFMYHLFLSWFQNRYLLWIYKRDLTHKYVSSTSW